MLTVNGRKYARNNAEFTSSLFDPTGTCNGFYKRIKGGIQLFDMQHELQAFVVDRPNSIRFAVTAHKQDGRTRYLHGLGSYTEKFLGANQIMAIEVSEV